jgi:UTP--glucose-1-phosphate uridylyltransferase
VTSDAFMLTEEWRVVPTPGREGHLIVDLDPTHYAHVDQLDARFPAGPPSLLSCRRLEVRGDVRFGAAVRCRGEVELRAAAARPCAVPDGALLEGESEALPL